MKELVRVAKRRGARAFKRRRSWVRVNLGFSAVTPLPQSPADKVKARGKPERTQSGAMRTSSSAAARADKKLARKNNRIDRYTARYGAVIRARLRSGSPNRLGKTADRGIVLSLFKSSPELFGSGRFLCSVRPERSEGCRGKSPVLRGAFGDGGLRSGTLPREGAERVSCGVGTRPREGAFCPHRSR